MATEIDSRKHPGLRGSVDRTHHFDQFQHHGNGYDGLFWRNVIKAYVDNLELFDSVEVFTISTTRHPADLVIIRRTAVNTPQVKVQLEVHSENFKACQLFMINNTKLKEELRAKALDIVVELGEKTSIIKIIAFENPESGSTVDAKEWAKARAKDIMADFYLKIQDMQRKGLHPDQIELAYSDSEILEYFVSVRNFGNLATLAQAYGYMRVDLTIVDESDKNGKKKVVIRFFREKKKSQQSHYVPSTKRRARS